jgi:hypothetical protein
MALLREPPPSTLARAAPGEALEAEATAPFDWSDPPAPAPAGGASLRAAAGVLAFDRPFNYGPSSMALLQGEVSPLAPGLTALFRPAESTNV